ncbi:MAG: M2 family metallopeptidase [Bacteroidales bacterium]|nr:M2 family metallopeptidase [Bacteroidales bacterium]
MLVYQFDSVKMNKLIEAEVAMEQKFSTFRAEVNGKKFTDNQIEDILVNSTNSNELKETWEASKQIGAFVADDVKQLVVLRNEIARDLGFTNFHEMSLKSSDQEPEAILALFDELDKMTKGAFDSLKTSMDEKLAKKYRIPVSQLMPWHSQTDFSRKLPKFMM